MIKGILIALLLVSILAVPFIIYEVHIQKIYNNYSKQLNDFETNSQNILSGSVNGQKCLKHTTNSDSLNLQISNLISEIESSNISKNNKTKLKKKAQDLASKVSLYKSCQTLCGQDSTYNLNDNTCKKNIDPHKQDCKPVTKPTSPPSNIPKCSPNSEEADKICKEYSSDTCQQIKTYCNTGDDKTGTCQGFDLPKGIKCCS